MENPLDPRYITIRGLLEQGEIKKFTDIFAWIPPSVLAKDFSTNHVRMKRMTENPGEWALKELYYLAKLLDYNPKKLSLMALEEVEKTM
jgi:hypothetical protein